MVKKISLILAVVMVFSFVFAACGKKNDSTEIVMESDSIVGRWIGEDEGFEVVYVFEENGTGYSEAIGMTIPITYEIDGDRITIVGDATSSMEEIMEMTVEEMIDNGYITAEDAKGFITTEILSFELEGDVLILNGNEFTREN